MATRHLFMQTGPALTPLLSLFYLLVLFIHSCKKVLTDFHLCFPTDYQTSVGTCTHLTCCSMTVILFLLFPPLVAWEDVIHPDWPQCMLHAFGLTCICEEAIRLPAFWNFWLGGSGGGSERWLQWQSKNVSAAWQTVLSLWARPKEEAPLLSFPLIFYKMVVCPMEEDTLQYTEHESTDLPPSLLGGECSDLSGTRPCSRFMEL